MSKKVECVCLEVAGGLNFTQPNVPISDCCACHGTGRMKVLATRTPLSRSGKEFGFVCFVCGRYQRVSMGSECHQAHRCSRHLEVRV